jgi:hypothetical protein
VRAKDKKKEEVFENLGAAGKELRGIGGGPKGHASGLQKKKHHINSLVADAVDAEQELIERKAWGAQNRANNRQRYGF